MDRYYISQYNIYSNYRTHCKGLITAEETFISACPLNVTESVLSVRYDLVPEVLDPDAFVPNADQLTSGGFILSVYAISIKFT